MNYNTVGKRKEIDRLCTRKCECSHGLQEGDRARYRIAGPYSLERETSDYTLQGSDGERVGRACIEPGAAEGRHVELFCCLTYNCFNF